MKLKIYNQTETNETEKEIYLKLVPTDKDSVKLVACSKDGVQLYAANLLRISRDEVFLYPHVDATLGFKLDSNGRLKSR